MSQLREPAAAALAAISLPDAPPPRTFHNRLALVLGIVIFSALSLWVGARSLGFLEADAMTHYMFARFSFREWSYFVNVWGRPLCTAVYAIPANLAGVAGARAMSLAMAVASALVVYRVAKNQRSRMPAMAAILLFAQPLFFAHSFSELTEIPFGLVAILALWAYQAKNFLAMAILVSISPTGRPEGLGLVLLAIAALIYHRRWYYLAILPVPCLLWSYFGWVSWDRPGDLPWYLWLKKNWPYAAKSAYGSGHWYYFIGILPVILSPMMFPFVFVGAWGCVKDALRPWVPWLGGAEDPPISDSAFDDAHFRRCAFFVAAIPLAVLVVHTFLWTFGLMASSGEPRYLLSVSPFWALVVARGWEWVWLRFRLPAPFLVAGLFATTPIFANRYYQVFPLRLYDGDLMGKAVAEWYEKTPGLAQDYPRVMATPPSVYYFMDLSQSDPKRGAAWGKDNVYKHTPGTILIWDPIFGQSNADRNLIVPKEELEAQGWIWIGNVVYGGDWCNVYLSPQSLSGAASDPDKYHAPGDVTPDN
ncbi:MAG TPA: hypothetical protein VH475_29120 [Tepidisphaeraceae bacterium]|jgi:hypothetical protein